MARFAFILLAGCSTALGGGTAETAVPAQEGAITESARVSEEDIRPLPFSQGRSFESLDIYLAFLAERGKAGVPWYREIKPGVYELVSRRGPGAEPRHFSRAELLQKFGFTDPPKTP